MKYIYIMDNTALEIIPEYDPIFPDVPIQERYAPDFLAHCVAVEDSVEVEQNWLYDPDTGVFSEPPPVIIPPPEEEIALTEQEINEAIERGVNSIDQA